MGCGGGQPTGTPEHGVRGQGTLRSRTERGGGQLCRAPSSTSTGSGVGAVAGPVSAGFLSFPQGPMAVKHQPSAPHTRSPDSTANGGAAAQGQWGRAW